MAITKENLTFVIQGPLHDNSIENIQTYLNYGNVIFSCWNTCDASKLYKVQNNTYIGNTSVKIIVNTFPDPINTEDVRQRLIEPSQFGGTYLQTINTYNGLLEVETDWVIKVRSDEIYYAWNHFIKTMQSNPTKLIISNIFAFPHDCWPFHISDHYFGGKTKLVLNTFDVMNTQIIKNKLIFDASLQISKMHF